VLHEKDSTLKPNKSNKYSSIVGNFTKNKHFAMNIPRECLFRTI